MTGKPMKCYLCGEEASLIREDLMSQVETINCPRCHLQYRVGDSFRDFYKGPLSHQKKLHLQNLIKSHPSILLEALHLHEGDLPALSPCWKPSILRFKAGF